MGDQILKLAEYLGVSLEYLVTGQNKQTNPIEDTAKKILEDGFALVHQGTYRITVERKKDKS